MIKLELGHIEFSRAPSDRIDPANSIKWIMCVKMITNILLLRESLHPNVVIHLSTGPINIGSVALE